MDSRNLLNKMKWHENYDFGKVKIWFTSRGSEGNASMVRGDEVIELGKYFFTTKSGIIPYHRIIKIEYGEEVVFRV